ncbi:ABC transporter permease [Dongia sedimenti]|uniref:ABC transporter permease subunit n=1 Tax=Dongia sedimenti TaxID=3064282 RepID=A0ABU0YP58_9PROT|nr:ABC transporter permease subunit [Rhodospirillaceae bacterium R-7]
MLRQSSPVSVQAGALQGVRRGFSLYDLVAAGLILAFLLAFADASRHMAAPMAAESRPISLSPWDLPLYALRSTMRMLAAMAASLVFTFAFASLAAKSRRAETILVPLLDILQSVPVLGFISVTVTAFMALAPGHALGAELAAIFAIFTSQAWNMAFSFYQSLKTIPDDLKEASRSLRFSAWMRFWRLEVPFAAPALIWNMMMSMSGGWFFVVACEAINVGSTNLLLPGIGSYIAVAVADRNLTAIAWAIAMMLAVILIYDQLLFRPLVAWSYRFRAGEEDETPRPRPWMLKVLQRSSLIDLATRPVLAGFDASLRWTRLAAEKQIGPMEPDQARPIGDRLWNAGLIIVGLAGAAFFALHVHRAFPNRDIVAAFLLGLPTLARVLVLIALASLVWVPIGIYIGLRPRLAAAVQPVAQMLAAFPANLLFPLAVSAIVFLDLNPDVWLSPLMVLGTQWYILFNVIAGASAIPRDLKDASGNLGLKGWLWWRDFALPAIFPYYLTGAITASGGSWNAAIVAEWVSWGDKHLAAHGIGAFIADATQKGDMDRVVLGIVVMIVYVIGLNRLLWRPLFALAERKYRMN